MERRTPVVVAHTPVRGQWDPVAAVSAMGKGLGSGGRDQRAGNETDTWRVTVGMLL